MKKKYFGKYVFLSFIIILTIYIVSAIVNVKLFNNGDFWQQIFYFDFNKPIGYIKLIMSIMIIVFGIFIEYIVNEKKKLEMELNIKNQRYELAMDAGNHAVWEIDIKNDKIYYSPMYYKMLGYEYNEFPMNRTVFDRLMHPDDKKEILPKILEYLNNASPYEEEFRLKCKDGSWKWILGRSRGYIKNKDGIVEKIIGTHSDISVLKKEQLKVIENKEKYQLLFENMVSGFSLCEMIYDNKDLIDHTFIEVNSKFEEIMGISKSKLIG
ncbi:PAS domain-containing protein, partial [Clostridiaceae bacterium HSG29]|nr:PAS domain-containing protein [Clostridiaceae bacterium HSG29]